MVRNVMRTNSNTRTTKYLFALSKRLVEISLIMMVISNRMVAMNMEIIMKRTMIVSPCGLYMLLVELVPLRQSLVHNSRNLKFM